MIEVKNLKAGYGKKEILHNVNFKINSGEIVTLVGSNGAGKSTILKCIYGINKIESGEVLYQNEIINSIEIAKLIQKGIIYIGQKSNTFQSMSVIENLLTAGYIYEKNELNEKIEAILSEFKILKEKINKKSNELSGGQRQLLALAMGLIHSPKVILFDEPSAGLDIKTLNLIFEKIKELNEKLNITFLIVEHRVKEIDKISDKFIGLKLGKIKRETKNIDELNEVFI